MPQNLILPPRPYSLLISIVSLAAFFTLSLYVSHFTRNTDFPVFYSTAKTVIKEGLLSNAIYTIDRDNKYQIPEPNKDLTFIYSKAAAIIISPLGFLPYYVAKSMMIFINILAYLFGTFIILQTLNIPGQKFIYLWGASFFWLPFIQVIRFGQVDGLIFICIAGALWLAENQQPFKAGALIGCAMLFKFFPLAIALILGLKNRRILASCLTIFLLSLLIPGSLEWFSAIPNIYHRAYSIIFTNLEAIGIWVYVVYCLLLGGLTAFFSCIYLEEDYLGVTAISLPVIFLTMPIVEYYHMTMLIISFLYPCNSINSLSKTERLALFSSIIGISASIKCHLQITAYVGLILLYLAIWSIIKTQKNTQISQVSVL